MNEENTILTREVILEKSPFWVEVTGFHIDGEENSWCENYVGCIFKVRQFKELDYKFYSTDTNRLKYKKKELFIIIELYKEDFNSHIGSILRKKNFKRLPDMKC